MFMVVNKYNGVSAIAYKERTKPKLLRIYEVLSNRMILSSDDHYYHLHLDKGFDGEYGLDGLTEPLSSHCLVLNDLQLEFRKSSFQVDTLLICTDKIRLYEVKNYEGVHTWADDKLLKSTGVYLENPWVQLQRTKVKLELLLQSLSCQMKVEAYVVYINPEFTLLEAKADGNYLLPSQVPLHFRSLQTKETPSFEQRRLAERLLQLHNPDYPPHMKPVYCYEDLRKGIGCPACGTVAEAFHGHFIKCQTCGERMNVKKAIKKNIEDFRLLFPDEKLTTNRMLDWCGSGDKDRIYRILRESYQPKGNAHGRYYI
jgi:hypothetical protein